MNWDAIGAVGEILGALAVVISIAYLSFQTPRESCGRGALRSISV